MTPRPDELFCLGVVAGTHGLRGDLKVRSLSGDFESLLDAEEVFLRRGDEVGCYKAVKVSPHKGNLLLRLAGLDDINAVLPLVGSEVLMRYGDLGPLAEDEFYWSELKGMQVVDQARGELGILEDLFTTAAHDVYVVRGRFGEVLIPAVDEFIVSVDRGHNHLRVDLPEGLISENTE
ncbi:MAG: ribosome maturation factor RimM [Desulfuromonadales bacterium]